MCSTAVEYFTDSWVLVIAKLSYWNYICKHILDLHQIRSRLCDLYPTRCRKGDISHHTLNIPTENCRHDFFHKPSSFSALTVMKWKAFWWETYFFCWLTLLTIGKLLTDYWLKGLIYCMFAGLELVKGRLGQELGMLSGSPCLWIKVKVPFILSPFSNCQDDTQVRDISDWNASAWYKRQQSVFCHFFLNWTLNYLHIPEDFDTSYHVCFPWTNQNWWIFLSPVNCSMFYPDT